MRIYDLDFNINLLNSILWQYNDAEKLQRLILNKAAFFENDTVGFWQNWYRDVFNLYTATDFGLVVWSIILGVSQDVQLGEIKTGPVWGFNAKNGGTLRNANQNFGHGNFSPGQNAIVVGTEQLRMLLKIRAMQLVSNGSAYDINRMLKIVFGDRLTYVRDNYNMSITYVFSQPPTAEELFIIEKTKAFVPPAGVSWTIQA